MLNVITMHPPPMVVVMSPPNKLYTFCDRTWKPTELYGLALSEDGFETLSDQDDGRVASSLQLRILYTTIWPPDRGISSLENDRF